MDDLFIYNTLTRKKEKFEPLVPGRVGMYVCGPTVYDHSHIGHAKSYISFDIIVRYLRFLGYKVRYVQNITDVGHLVGDGDSGADRILEKARLEKTEPMEVVEFYTRSYFEDMDILGLVRPDISPRASGHIIEQIEMIRTLIDKNLAYEANGNVYFNVHQFPGYGKLSGRKLEELEAGTRVEVAEDKKHPADFALWKKADPGHLMQWPSPWGAGYPGWHIECSCMATKYLGESIDIHGGGLENIFPHHECEIAQSEGVYEKPFVKYWVHNNMVNIDNTKMGKSLKNFITIKEAVQQYNPMDIRFFILGSHYRSVLDFTEEALLAAGKGLRKMQKGIARLKQAAGENQKVKNAKPLPVEAYEVAFKTAMNDDFNTSRAIAAIFDLLSEVNRRSDSNDEPLSASEAARADELLQKTAGEVLGIYAIPETAKENEKKHLDDIMELLLDMRNKLRQDKNFTLADYLRDELTSRGIQIKDTPQGPQWEILDSD